ncbi:MAG: sigma-70 family RNA polymerase sigma factor [Spongiibacteraceae bacterium]
MELSLDDMDALLPQLRSGDADSFRQLVARYHGALVGVARTFLRDGEAEEAVQEAWVSAYRHIARFEGRSSLRTWLTRIVINEAKMRLRRNGREILLNVATVETEPLADRFDAGGHWAQGPQQWDSQSPEALLEERDLLDCLRRTLAKLPTNQRAVLELRDFQGEELDAICNMLEISASNVRVLLHRARTQLFSVVDHYQETGEC